jgi:hypothetical protein
MRYWGILACGNMYACLRLKMNILLKTISTAAVAIIIIIIYLFFPVPSDAVGKDCQRQLLSRPKVRQSL